jgi:hypothetical protein
MKVATAIVLVVSAALCCALGSGRRYNPALYVPGRIPQALVRLLPLAGVLCGNRSNFWPAITRVEGCYGSHSHKTLSSGRTGHV